MEAAKNKFLAHGKGVVMSKLQSFEDANAQAQVWHDLIDPSKWSTQAIANRMKNLYKNINDACPDPVLGKAEVYFTFTTERDEVIEYTYADAYLFLRAALVERQSTAEYKTKTAKISELKATIAKAKTPKQLAKEAAEELASLEASL